MRGQRSSKMLVKLSLLAILRLAALAASDEPTLATEEAELKGLSGILSQIDSDVLEQQLNHVRAAKNMGLAAGPLSAESAEAHAAECVGGLQLAVDIDKQSKDLPGRPAHCWPADGILHNPSVKLLAAADAEATEITVLAVDGCTGLGWQDGHGRTIDETPKPSADDPKPKKVKRTANAGIKLKVWRAGRSDGQQQLYMDCG